MSKTSEIQDFLMQLLRLKTFPVAARLCRDDSEMPEKVRFPSAFLKKKVTVCQAVTMARNYGWTVGMREEDFQCVPAAIGFGFSGTDNPGEAMVELFCKVDFSQNAESGLSEVESMALASKGEFRSLLFSPLARASFEPQVLIIYGNAAQMMRIAQAWSYSTGRRVSGNFGGKVECVEYLVKPLKNGDATIVIPGNGERIFAGTQDDELVFAVPWEQVENLVKGLERAGKAIGARYPITPYVNYEPQFPPVYSEMGKRFGAVFKE
ncbi:DUF169 domain-containing protein [Thermodesulforhabdus norvegica]|uniref:Uncharacterized conserved protein, DUF169 family n=1 Tax=Thermodesulforhabdus norvegica TaxID=39841 RepID=A0A1I4TTK8_9BACT|nr:DUF169 domain-containing protein [Thermodesulforhabdus norvegica]SFM80068.1 Uncharacterized conserved protein, DUF169 family [Thermodesulforhabdus norvegica]